MKFKSIYLIAAALVILAAASCKKDLTKTNTDPNKIGPDQYDPNLLLTTVQLMYTGSTNFGGSAWATKWGGAACFIQHTASTNTGFYYGDKYLNNINAMGEMFQDSYTSEVQPVVELYLLTANNPKYRNLHQMARMMRAMVFQQLTDLYGDIPYKQAGLGYYNRIYTPVYDSQQDIYTDMLKEVSQATDSLSDSADKPTGDILYSQSGDQINKWRKFGNSLLLRIAMRLTKIDNATAETYVKQAAGHTMQSNDDNAIVLHQAGNALTENRDASEIFGNDSTDLRLSKTFVDVMKNTNDPRLPVVSFIYTTSGNTDDGDFQVSTDNDPDHQIGMPNGYIVGGSNPNFDIRTKDPNYPAIGIYGYSRLNNTILNTSAPTLILTYAETELLLAEATKRWGSLDKSSAQQHYENGVAAAITQYDAYGVNVDVGDYLANGDPYDDANAYEQIGRQYWLCTLMDEYEAYANWRRTGYPTLTPTNYPGNVTGGAIPRRLNYPQNQKITNAASYNAAVARLNGGDKITSRVWWDKKTD